MNKILKLTAVGMILALWPLTVHAVPIQVDFTVTGFTIVGGSNPAPTDPASGSIVYESFGPTFPIIFLTSVSLTLDGHNYTVPELGFTTLGPDQVVGGLTAGVTGVSSSNNDFFLSWNLGTGLPSQFVYASASDSSGLWVAFPGQFTSFSVVQQSTMVAEPSTMLLLGFGLAGIGFMRRRAVG